jgi:serine/threonine protein kinase
LAAGRGLAAAHDAGLVHRDFKPDNVLVGDGGEVRVTDFGLARSAEATKATPSTRALGATECLDLTRSGMLVGTPAYMAPEQMRGEPATARSDIFSFCAALYEGLHGVRPFEGATLHELRDNIVTGQVRAGSSYTRIPPRLRGALARGLRPRPEERFASMHDLLGELERSLRPNVLPLAPALGTAAALALIAGVARPDARASLLSRANADLRNSASIAAEARPALAQTAAPDATAAPPRDAQALGNSRESRVPQPLGEAAGTRASGSSLTSSPAAPPPSVIISHRAAGDPAQTQPVPPPPRAPAAPLAIPPAVNPAPADDTPPGRPGCDPDYSYDEQGNKHFKRECFINP